VLRDELVQLRRVKIVPEIDDAVVDVSNGE
jgi:hypothetical protein